MREEAGVRSREGARKEGRKGGEEGGGHGRWEEGREGISQINRSACCAFYSSHDILYFIACTIHLNGQAGLSWLPRRAYIVTVERKPQG